MNEYAFYLRKSRADIELEALGSGETLSRHQTILLDLAEKRGILPSQITIYKEVVSGETLAARPQMQKLLDNVYKHSYKAVFCMEIERLARGNTRDQGEVADAFTYSGTHIITPAKEYDPLNEFDQEYFEFGLFMSRREYKTIQRRMEAGRLQSVREGNYVGSLRPFGYDIQRINKKERILVLKEDEAQIVRLIFNWFTEEKVTCGEIARRLTAMRIPTLTGNTEWNRGVIVEILKNHHYYGAVRWNKRKRYSQYENGTVSKKKRRTELEELEIYPGKHEALITKDQFDKAQERFVSVPPVKACTTLINPLAGILRCPDCGKSIHYDAYKSREGRTQPRYVHSAITCKAKSCNAEIVLQAVSEGLKAAIDDFAIRMSDESVKAEFEQSKAVLSSLESELTKAKKRKDRLFDIWESDENIYTKEEFLQRKSVYDGMISDIEEQIAEAKRNAPKRIDYTERIVTMHKAVDMIQDPAVDAKAKNDFLKTLIDRIDYAVEDFGRGKGCKPNLTIYLKE